MPSSTENGRPRHRPQRSAWLAVGRTARKPQLPGDDVAHHRPQAGRDRRRQRLRRRPRNRRGSLGTEVAKFDQSPSAPGSATTKQSFCSAASKH